MTYFNFQLRSPFINDTFVNISYADAQGTP